MFKNSEYLENTHPDLAQFFHPNYALRPISTTFTATITNGSEYQNPGYWFDYATDYGEQQNEVT